jgi:hypothetical protein
MPIGENESIQVQRSIAPTISDNLNRLGAGFLLEIAAGNGFNQRFSP